ncbi:MAG: hypothetical protein HYY18_03835 [Planctomycetes bacterium]|nr:hypothetical protein [Planctomycetota bacterium]
MAKSTSEGGPLPEWAPPPRELRGLEKLIRTALENGADALFVCSRLRPVAVIRGAAKEMGERELPHEEVRPLIDELFGIEDPAFRLAEGHKRAMHHLPPRTVVNLYLRRTADVDLLVVTVAKG